MARGSEQARGAATSAQNFSNAQQGEAGSLYSTLAPELTAQSIAPSGFTPTQKAAMNTAGQQSAGGTQAAAVGAGALAKSRTRNAGAGDSAIQQSARSAGQQASDAALKTEMADAQLAERKRAMAQEGLGNLYGGATRGAVGALGIVPEAVNANTNAENASWNWAKYLFDPIISAGGGMGAAALGG